MQDLHQEVLIPAGPEALRLDAPFGRHLLQQRRRPGGAQAPFFAQLLQDGSHTRADLALLFLNSDEAYVRTINGLYTTFLGRAVDLPTLQLLLSPTAGGYLPPVSLAAAVLGSQEYLARKVALGCLGEGT